MKAEHINPFLNATISVMSTMAMITPKPLKPYLKKDESAAGDISGIIGITGNKAIGSIAVSFAEKCILKIVSNMLGEPFTEMNHEVRDAVGEITNMISGLARKELAEMGVTLEAAIPTVVSGKNHQIKHMINGPSIVIPFQTDDGPFSVDVCLQEI
ncbi:MAG: chemotaxis protein CheX [Deltaproteobacteria bacterium]|nr:chemotaxis protein CheX [Deltaproteobacteria bacterium]